MSTSALLSPAAKDEMVRTFLKSFPTNIQHREPKCPRHLWVFWSKDEASKKLSSLADVGTRMIYDKIKSAFCTSVGYTDRLIVQFWAPVTIGGRQLLSTSGQPFAVCEPSPRLATYRLHCLEYQYNMDVTNEIEDDPMIINNGALTFAFLNHLPEIVTNVREGSPLAGHALDASLNTSLMLPVCFPSETSACCIGVIECSMTTPCDRLDYLRKFNSAFQDAGLSIFHVQEHIPYKTIDGVKSTRDEIEKALKTVCKSHHIRLAQVWIPYQADVPFSSSSSSSEDKQTKYMLALKLTGYYDFLIVESYSDLCDALPLTTRKSLVEKTLQDHQPRFYEIDDNFNRYQRMAFTDSWHPFKAYCLVICLRSIDTGDLCYAFEFIWFNMSTDLMFLEELLSTLKRCLPNFKFASGQQLGDELHVINSTGDRKDCKIFQVKRVSPPMLLEALEKEKKPIVNLLPRKVIEQQMAKCTQAAVAKNTTVNVSTLKRKCMRECQGPNIIKKEKVNEPYKIENKLTIKAEYAGDMIKFHVCISQALFATVEEEIGKQFKLSVGMYKLKYRDEDGDWILLTSDQDMSDCIKSCRNSDPKVVRVRVELLA